MNKGIRFTDEFKQDAVAQVVEPGNAVSEPPRFYRRVKFSKDDPYDTTQTYPVLHS